MAVHSSVFAWEIHGQRRLAGYSPWGCKRVIHDLMTKQQHTRIYLHRYIYISIDIYIHICIDMYIDIYRHVYTYRETRIYTQRYVYIYTMMCCTPETNIL